MHRKSQGAARLKGFFVVSYPKTLWVQSHVPIPECNSLSFFVFSSGGHNDLLQGLVMGETGKKEEWKSHVFYVTNSKGKKFKLHAFIRIEFQDGTRKRPSESDPLGSGRPHLHVIIFGEDEAFENMNFAEFASYGPL